MTSDSPKSVIDILDQFDKAFLPELIDWIWHVSADYYRYFLTNTCLVRLLSSKSSSIYIQKNRISDALSTYEI